MEGPDKRRPSARTAAILLGIVLAYCDGAFALEPSLQINQYGHRAWTVREGFFKGSILSLAQGADGYLWVGTELGLLRFDGVRAVPLEAPNGQEFLSSQIWHLLVTRDGTLWIGTRKGLGSWKDGTLTIHPEFAGQRVNVLMEDREGTLWVATQ